MFAFAYIRKHTQDTWYMPVKDRTLIRKTHLACLTSATSDSLSSGSSGFRSTDGPTGFRPGPRTHPGVHSRYCPHLRARHAVPLKSPHALRWFLPRATRPSLLCPNCLAGPVSVHVQLGPEPEEAEEARVEAAPRPHLPLSSFARVFYGTLQACHFPHKSARIPGEFSR